MWPKFVLFFFISLRFRLFSKLNEQYFLLGESDLFFSISFTVYVNLRASISVDSFPVDDSGIFCWYAYIVSVWIFFYETNKTKASTKKICYFSATEMSDGKSVYKWFFCGNFPRKRHLWHAIIVKVFSQHDLWVVSVHDKIQIFWLNIISHWRQTVKYMHGYYFVAFNKMYM